MRGSPCRCSSACTCNICLKGFTLKQTRHQPIPHADGCDNVLYSAMQVGLVFSIYSFASVAASPLLGRCVQLGYIRRVTLLLSGLLVVSCSYSWF